MNHATTSGTGMSGGDGKGTGAVLCRYFMSNMCRKGASCPFSHDRSHAPSMVCRYYTQGRCAYGAGCRYDHVRPPTTNHHQPTSPPQRPTAPKPSVEPSLRAEAPEFVPSSAFMSAFEGACADDIVDLYDELSDEAESEFEQLQPRLQRKKVVVPPVVDRAVKPVNYASAVSGPQGPQASTSQATSLSATKAVLCPYYLTGQCWYGEDRCSFAHGLLCDLCGAPALHPTNEEYNIKHRKECIDQHERAMEESFAAARSQDKTCGICMETVMEKRGGRVKQRFGILQNCKHVFCLDCMRKWRASRTFDNKIVRACPECRTLSDFIIPSAVWVDDEEEKARMTEEYRRNLSDKSCKYFRAGSGECPFGNRCFYKHANPDGTLVEGDSPRTIRRRQERATGSSMRDYTLWAFIEERQARAAESLANLSTTSDDDFAFLLELALDDELAGMRFDDHDSDSDSDTDDIDVATAAALGLFD